MASPVNLSSDLKPVQLLLMLAAAVGDCLGVSSEGFCPQQSPLGHSKSISGLIDRHRSSDFPWPMHLVGGRNLITSYKWPIGEPTDDTQMALAIVDTFASTGLSHRFLITMTQRFIQWKSGAGPYKSVGPARDVGLTIGAALSQLSMVNLVNDLQLVQPHVLSGKSLPVRQFHAERISTVWKSMSNGALMRNIGVVVGSLHLSDVEAIALTVGHTLITHHLPMVVLCSIIHTLLIRHLLRPLMKPKSAHAPHADRSQHSAIDQLKSFFASPPSAPVSSADAAASSSSTSAPASTQFIFTRDFVPFIDDLALSSLLAWMDVCSESSSTQSSAMAMSALWLRIVSPKFILNQWETLTTELKQSHLLDVFGRSYEGESGYCVLTLQIALWSAHVSTLPLSSSPFITPPDWLVKPVVAGSIASSIPPRFAEADRWITQCRGFDTVKLLVTIGADADTYATTASGILAAMFPRDLVESNLIHELRPEDYRSIVATVNRLDRFIHTPTPVLQIVEAATNLSLQSDSKSNVSSSSSGMSTSSSAMSTSESVIDDHSLTVIEQLQPSKRTAPQWRTYLFQLSDDCVRAQNDSIDELKRTTQLMLDETIAYSQQFEQNKLVIDSFNRPALMFMAAIGDQNWPVEAIDRLIDRLSASKCSAEMTCLYRDLMKLKESNVKTKMKLSELQESLRMIIIKNIQGIIMLFEPSFAHHSSTPASTDDQPSQQHKRQKTG